MFSIPSHHTTYNRRTAADPSIQYRHSFYCSHFVCSRGMRWDDYSERDYGRMGNYEGTTWWSWWRRRYENMGIWGMRHPTTRDEKNPKMRMEKSIRATIYLSFYVEIRTNLYTRHKDTFSYNTKSLFSFSFHFFKMKIRIGKIGKVIRWKNRKLCACWYFFYAELLGKGREWKGGRWQDFQSFVYDKNETMAFEDKGNQRFNSFYIFLLHLLHTLHLTWES